MKWHKNHVSSDVSVHSSFYLQSYDKNKPCDCWSKNLFFFFVRPSQMNYLQSASPMTFLRVHECLFHFSLISVVIILTLVMQSEPQALYVSHLVWKARNLKNRKQKQKKDSFWVQNLISFAQHQYNSFSLWE